MCILKFGINVLYYYVLIRYIFYYGKLGLGFFFLIRNGVWFFLLFGWVLEYFLFVVVFVCELSICIWVDFGLIRWGVVVCGKMRGFCFFLISLMVFVLEVVSFTV